MNPKQFLLIGGVVLILVGILGFIGIIGPTADRSIFGGAWWFDNAENWAHLVIGVVGVIAAYALSGSTQKPLVLLLGIVGVLVGLYSLVISEAFLGANLENPADTILHIVVGAWALYAGTRKEGGTQMPSGMPS
jgi:hypothetical protein